MLDRSIARLLDCSIARRIMTAACACLPSVTFAGDLTPASIELEGWVFVGTHTDGLVDAVITFRSAYDGAKAINAIRYEHVNGSWVAQTWEGATFDQVASFLVNGGHVNVTPAHDWPVQISPGYQSTPQAQPQPFANGVLTGDPLEALLESMEDPASLLVILESLGYSAVAAPSTGVIQGTDPLNGCGTNSTGFSDAFLYVVSESLSRETTQVDTGVDHFDVELDALLCFCIPWTWTTTTTLGTWSASGNWTAATLGRCNVPGPEPYGVGSYENCTGECFFQRSGTKPDSHRRIHRYSDCTRAQCFQTRNWTAWEVRREEFLLTPYLCDINQAQCEQNPDNAFPFAPTCDEEHTGWMPPCVW